MSSIDAYSQEAQDSLLESNIDDVIEELQLMYHLDQSLRNFVEYGEFDSNTDRLDSLNIESSLSKSTRDNIWDFTINPIDSIKSERMIKIIEVYGFPSVDRLEKLSGKDIDFNPIILLVHTPFKMAKKLIPIVNEEFKKGNFRSSCEYGYILWHLHGRSDFKYMLENGYKMETDEKGKFKLISTCD